MQVSKYSTKVSEDNQGAFGMGAKKQDRLTEVVGLQMTSK